jgi:tRNA dimethylallyltransferase
LADAELRVICGPTAAGKSALAMRLAAREPVTVISADSRQVYRRFDIGTAKPSLAERQRVPHEGIDVAEPTERYSAAAWSHDAKTWIDTAHERQRLPLIVGGTGFYLRALAAPLFEEPPLDPMRRADLARVLAAMSTSELRRWCTELDLPRAHLGRTQLLRAIEIAVLTGRPISEWHREHARAPSIKLRWLLLNPSRPALAQRIEHRAREMLNAGWEDEVRELMRDIPDDAPAWNATGYRAVKDRVRGTLGRDAMLDRIVIDTRQYAKRQRTWFRHQLASDMVTEVDPDAPDADRLVARWWSERRQA